MPCSSSQNTLNPIIPSFPGFGSPIQISLPSFDLPTDLLEAIQELLNKLGTILPFGFSANPDLSMKTIYDLIANLLSQIAPFLSFYNFIMALLKMIICIIEVLCALPNPFAVASALVTLFTECLPPFFNLFPFLALIAMIIALLLLILLLIAYIIETIILIIEEIILNLVALGASIAILDAESVLTISAKIASLLCFIENLLAILIAIAAILAIIELLALIGGIIPCGPDSPTNCCSDATCPPFIKNTPDGIPVSSGKLIYMSKVGVDLPTVLGITSDQAALLQVPPIREERWQLLNNDQFPQFTINLIITPQLITTEDPPVFSGIFWPDPLEFQSDLSPKTAPYTADMTIEMDPGIFHSFDTKGRRKFNIKNCIVVRKPYNGILTFNNLTDLSNVTGTLNIEGGHVFEADGTKYFVDGYHATLNTFIHKDDIISGVVPALDDSFTFDNISFTWKPNAPGIAGFGLVPFSCVPQVALPKAVINAALTAENLSPVAVKLPPGFLPDVLGAQKCVTDALAEFRKDVSEVGAAKFQAAMETCLNNLKNQTTQSICSCIVAGASMFKSTVALDTDIQFTTRPINVTIILKDASGTTLSNQIPVECDVAKELIGEVTLGNISKFIYDGTSSFKAEITSDKAGAGLLTILFGGKVLSKINNSGTVTASIEELNTPYQFVEAVVTPPVRRDDTDVAGLDTE